MPCIRCVHNICKREDGRNFELSGFRGVNRGKLMHGVYDGELVLNLGLG